MHKVYIKDDFIKLGQALKLAGLVESGLDAKYAIQEGEVLLNPLYLFREDYKKRGETVEGGLIKIGEMVHRKKMEIAGIREETSQGK